MSLLLQHGYAEHAGRYVDSYSRLIPCLVSQGYDVHAFDMRGHGSSPGVRGAADVEQTVRDHLFARTLLQREGKPLFLYGHSLGGLVTAASVAQEQDQVAGVILSSPALLLGVHPAARWLAALLRKLSPNLGIASRQSPSGLSRDIREVEKFEADPLVYRGKMPAVLGASAIAIADASWPLYRKWRVPTLTMHGTDDTYTNPRGSALFDALIQSPTHQMMMVDGGRHELLNDVDRTMVLTATLSWLKALASE